MTISKRVFACGVTGSGKTAFLARHFLDKEPRLLVVDNTGEWEERGTAPATYGLAETAAALGEYAREKAKSWRHIAYLDTEEVEELSARLLIPVPHIKRGYSAGVGGMALMLDEVDVFTPGGQSSAELRNLWRRGRHCGLSVYAATQRPANVSKEVTSQCRYLVILRQHETRDVEYLRGIIGKSPIVPIMRHVSRGEFRACLWDTEEARGYLLDAAGKVTGQVSGRMDEQVELE